MKNARSILVGAVVFSATFLANAPVWAHASLSQSEPKANATLAEAPKQVELQFTEPLEATFSGIQVMDAEGKPVTTDKASIDASAMHLALPVLKAGSYKVRWNAVTRDGHRVKGDYGFAVK